MRYPQADHNLGCALLPDQVAAVILDLAGTGIRITQLSSSNMYFDMAGDGLQHRTAWAGVGNGVLVLDLADSNQITQRNQIVFTDWDPNTTYMMLPEGSSPDCERRKHEGYNVCPSPRGKYALPKVLSLA